MLPTGQTIRDWRVSKRLTQQALAAQAGLSRPNLSAIEQGGRDLTVETLRRIAFALRVNPGTLVDGIGPGPQFAPINQNRFSIDRVTRLAAGQEVKASPKERRLALALGFVMKAKTGKWAAVRARRRTGRSENETLLRLKSELGPEMLRHLIRRMEKHIE